jgi:hypothetical protein
MSNTMISGFMDWINYYDDNDEISAQAGGIIKQFTAMLSEGKLVSGLW